MMPEPMKSMSSVSASKPQAMLFKKMLIETAQNHRVDRARSHRGNARRHVADLNERHFLVGAQVELAETQPHAVVRGGAEDTDANFLAD